MARWEPGTRERLERAALELFAEVGFAETTVPQITARAGLTTRTFFRYFADKREVLFAGEDEYTAQVADLVAAAPPGTSVMALMVNGLRVLAEQHFEGRREHLRTRRAIVAGDDGLRERDLHKQAALAEVVAQGLRTRGMEDPEAVLVARTATTVFATAVERWLDAGEDRPLAVHVQEVMGALASLTAGLAEVVPRR